MIFFTLSKNKMSLLLTWTSIIYLCVIITDSLSAHTELRMTIVCPVAHLHAFERSTMHFNFLQGKTCASPRPELPAHPAFNPRNEIQNMHVPQLGHQPYDANVVSHLVLIHQRINNHNQETVLCEWF